MRHIVVLILFALVFVACAAYGIRTAQAILAKRYAQASSMLYNIWSIFGDNVIGIPESQLCAFLAGKQNVSDGTWQKLFSINSPVTLKLKMYMNAYAGDWDAVDANMKEIDSLISESNQKLEPGLLAEIQRMHEVTQHRDNKNLYNDFNIAHDVKEMEQRARLLKNIAYILIVLAFAIPALALI